MSVTLIAVSNPLREVFEIGTASCGESAVDPDSCQVSTSVAPFQLVYTVVLEPSVSTKTEGRVLGVAVQL